MELLFVISGLLVGFVVGISGVGGGSLMTPLLVMGFGVPPTTAVGTDLLYAGFTKIGGTIFRGKLGSVNWRVAFLLALGSVPAAIFTSVYYLSPVQIDSASSILITKTLGVMLCITAIALVFRSRLQRLTQGIFDVKRTGRRARILIATLSLGAVLGILVTLTSVGAGAIGVTALLVLYPHLPANHLAGTDIVHAVPLTLVAGLSHAVSGSVDYHLLLTLLIGSLPGVVMGSLVAHRIPERPLQWVIGSVLFLVGLKLFF